MTDAFFPAESPSEEELELIHLIKYTATPPKKGKFTIKVLDFKTNRNFGDPVFCPTTLPEAYYTHVRHFLWRHHLLMQIDKNSRIVPLPNDFRRLVQQYIAYMDAMIESLLMPARRNPYRPIFRSLTFDLYLVTEHQVGRHEYDIGDRWRCSHKDIILETINVTSLDWQAFYESQDSLHPVWSGAKYDFEIARVPSTVEAYQELVDVAAAFFGFEAIDMEGRILMAAKGKKRANPSDDIPEPSGRRRKRKAIEVQL